MTIIEHTRVSNFDCPWVHTVDGSGAECNSERLVECVVVVVRRLVGRSIEVFVVATTVLWARQAKRKDLSLAASSSTEQHAARVASGTATG